ncbi:16S rRNA (cytosine(967)-C(5))-methyltransferase RsmB [Denitrobaculum tricleocarpae]|uniref:16S rRNA (cytosine(967)-C(5))-methyltransferase n=1 Tax=Denitrobaculum tricleocarpae TaxID=2591009 RepID=A0A545TRA0_9PROT|nr:16S rRNA (cytosine(967)-C(5))-methyltransferase RsmB [Denitrobaculum tricleocarpae]TQV79744.1 16S rRNA (cytosine(967)-C(5))-methyltransferase RsmB [Denitrobaculum tricleocarpae]
MPSKRTTSKSKRNRQPGETSPGQEALRAQAPRTGKGPNPRRIAATVLNAVLRQETPLDDALNAHKDLPNLDARDRAFVRLLTTTVLRRLGQIDDLIAHCLDRPLKAKFAEAEDLIRMGAAQLLFLETPPHAALSTTLALATTPRTSGQKGLINAILRRLDREGRALVEAQDAARLNTPDWLWQSWSEAYGDAQVRAIAESNLKEPPLDLTIKTESGDWVTRMANAGLDAQKLPGGSVRIGHAGDVRRLPGYDRGHWWVQDVAATLPARLLGEIEDLRVIDLCAAPGGKTAQLAAAGAKVTAVDRSTSRLRRLSENLDRLNLSAEVIAANATRWQPKQPADAVLLDAPCSATGTLRRHPDIAWLRNAGDIASVTELQDSLLNAAAEMVKPGGLLVYATCSLQPQEGPERIAALLETRKDLERIPLTAEELGEGLEAAITADGDLRTLPSHLSDLGGMDGFFACRLRRL